MQEEYVNKKTVKYMIALVVSDYEKNGIDSVEPSVIKEDLFNVIDAISSINVVSKEGK